MQFEAEAITRARLLIVDDEERNTRVLEMMLNRAGYTNLTTMNDSRRVIPEFEAVKPDLILLDLRMPYMDGFAVMQQLASLLPPGTYVPILVLTADITPEAKQKALAEGASDFLTKPFDVAEVLLRIRNLLKTYFLNQDLEERVRERTQEIRETQLEVLERLARAGEYRDDDTGQHTRRVGNAAALLASALGLPDEHVMLILRAAPLHDVGKIGISDTILLKPGKLTDEEFDIMRTHTTIGAAMLSGGRSELVKIAETIAISHHERWDGSGYPNRVKGEDIPIEGRILTIADVFDALTHERPYKKAWPALEAAAEIERQSGRQFDPRVVEAFQKLPLDTLL